MVDVDYYVDMPEFLANNFRPVVLYTFQPKTVARCDGEYSYTFHKDGEVEYIVSGGATYRHKVWNYAGDSIKVRKWYKLLWWSILVEVMTFQLERKQVDEDHQMILLAPEKKYVGLAAWIADLMLAGGSLERLNPVEGDFLRMVTKGEREMLTHTGKPGRFMAATLATDKDDALEIQAMHPKLDLQQATVRAMKPEGNAEVLWQYHLRKMSNRPRAQVHLSTLHVQTYTLLPRIEEFDAEQSKPTMTAFMKPLVDGTFAPANNGHNEARSIERRVLKKPTFEPAVTPLMLVVMKEFVSHVTTGLLDETLLHPVDLCQVFENQSTPQQTAILERADLLLKGDDRVKAFMKKEAYQKLADPRNISTVSGVRKREGGKYAYALNQAMKRLDCYAFGKTPKEIAERVTLLAQNATHGIFVSDISRMDKDWSQFSHSLVRTIMFALFEPVYHDEIREVLDGLVNNEAKGALGYAYHVHWSLISGTVFTSCFQTLVNMFMAYFALRMTRVAGVVLKPEEAWAKMGMYGGDDGITPDLQPASFASAARHAGFEATGSFIRKDESGVTFLARVYGPELWHGNNNSMCDLRRQIVKFHTTANMPEGITAERKLLDKSFSFYLSDKETPIIGDYVSKVMESKPDDYEYKNLTKRWMAGNTEPGEQYPNERGEWMMAAMGEALPDFDYGGFLQWLATADSLKKLLDVPTLHPPVKPAAPADTVSVVNGDQVDEVEQQSQASQVKKAITETPPVATQKASVQEPTGGSQSDEKQRGAKPKHVKTRNETRNKQPRKTKENTGTPKKTVGAATPKEAAKKAPPA
jgi:hypothetical protein